MHCRFDIHTKNETHLQQELYVILFLRIDYKANICPAPFTYIDFQMPAVDASMSTKIPGNHAGTTSVVCLGDLGQHSAAEYPFVSKITILFQ